MELNRAEKEPTALWREREEEMRSATWGKWKFVQPREVKWWTRAP